MEASWTGQAIRPAILNGPPGIGKSVWARSLAAALEIPFADVDATKGGAGMVRLLIFVGVLLLERRIQPRCRPTSSLK